MPYYSNLNRIVCIYFVVFAILTLIFCLSWGTKLNKHNQNGALSESYKEIYDKNVFFLYKNLSLLLILFITFKAIDSPRKSFIQQATKVCHCMILLNEYLTIFNLKAFDFIKSMFCAK